MSSKCLWSLKDVVELKLRGLLRLWENLEAMATNFAIAEAYDHDDPDRHLSDNERSDLGRLIQNALAYSKTIGLTKSTKTLGRRLADLPQTRRELEHLREAIEDDIDEQVFLHVSSHVAKHYENEDVLSETARAAFPNAYTELRSAGNCLACSQYTASVFHSMRAAELGVRVMGKSLAVTFPDKDIEYAEWQPTLNSIYVKVKDIGQEKKTADRDERLEIYSKAVVASQSFKDG